MKEALRCAMLVSKAGNAFFQASRRRLAGAACNLCPSPLLLKRLGFPGHHFAAVFCILLPYPIHTS